MQINLWYGVIGTHSLLSDAFQDSVNANIKSLESRARTPIMALTTGTTKLFMWNHLGGAIRKQVKKRTNGSSLLSAHFPENEDSLAVNYGMFRPRLQNANDKPFAVFMKFNKILNKRLSNVAGATVTAYQFLPTDASVAATALASFSEQMAAIPNAHKMAFGRKNALSTDEALEFYNRHISLYREGEGWSDVSLASIPGCQAGAVELTVKSKVIKP